MLICTKDLYKNIFFYYIQCIFDNIIIKINIYFFIFTVFNFVRSYFYRFSIWNTILGSSLLTIPWGIQMAGFFPGILLILIMSGLCLYTAYCLLLVHNYYGKNILFFLYIFRKINIIIYL